MRNHVLHGPTQTEYENSKSIINYELYKNSAFIKMIFFSALLVSFFLSFLALRFLGRARLVLELTGFEYLGAMGVFFGLIAFPYIYVSFCLCLCFSSFIISFICRDVAMPNGHAYMLSAFGTYIVTCSKVHMFLPFDNRCVVCLHVKELHV